MSFPDEWKRIAEKELKSDPIALVRKVREGIEVKPIYTASDLDGIEHLDTLPGMSPLAAVERLPRSLPPVIRRGGSNSLGWYIGNIAIALRR